MATVSLRLKYSNYCFYGPNPVRVIMIFNIAHGQEHGNVHFKIMQICMLTLAIHQFNLE